MVDGCVLDPARGFPEDGHRHIEGAPPAVGYHKRLSFLGLHVFVLLPERRVQSKTDLVNQFIQILCVTGRAHKSGPLMLASILSGLLRVFDVLVGVAHFDHDFC